MENKLKNGQYLIELDFIMKHQLYKVYTY